MKLTRVVYDTHSQKRRDFLLGYLGWFVGNLLLNALLFGASWLASTVLLTDANGSSLFQTIVGWVSLGCNALLLLANLGLIVYFALTRYWIALGILAAFATALVLAICAAVLFGAACFAMFSGYTP